MFKQNFIYLFRIFSVSVIRLGMYIDFVSEILVKCIIINLCCLIDLSNVGKEMHDWGNKNKTVNIFAKLYMLYEPIPIPVSILLYAMK